METESIRRYGVAETKGVFVSMHDWFPSMRFEALADYVRSAMDTKSSKGKEARIPGPDHFPMFGDRFSS
jgi:hypothetical protein